MSNIRVPEQLTAEERKRNVRRFLEATGNNQAVSFVFSTPPQTDGKTVYVGTSEVSDTFEVRALGHGLHEMMHVAETDMLWLSKQKTGELERLFFNILEDVRIDTIGLKRYPGYRHWREELLETLQVEGTRRGTGPIRTTGIELFLDWLHAALYADLHVFSDENNVRRLRNALETQVDAKHLDSLLRSAQAVHRASDTQETYRIAVKLSQHFQDFAKNPEEKDAPSQSQKSEGKLPSQTKENFFQAAVRQASLMPKTQTEFAPVGTPASPASTQGSSGAIAWTDAMADKRIQEDAQVYRPIFQSELPRLNILAKRFEKLLAVRTEADPEPGMRGTELGADFVSRVIAKDPRIFRAESMHDAVDADVVVLLDRSGSMGEKRMTHAKIAVVALLLALKKVRDVDTTLAAFPGIARTAILRIKDSSESDRNLLTRMASLGAFGATPMPEALQWAREQLQHSRRSLRMTVLVTDGVYPPSRISEVVRQYEEDRIELAVLNIDTENPGLAENTVTVDESDDIGQGLLTLMQRSKTARSIRSKR